MGAPARLASHQGLLKRARERLASLLKQGDADAMSIAIQRRLVQLMAMDLEGRTSPPPLDPIKWQRLKQQTALDQMMGSEATERRWRQRHQQYLDFAITTISTVPLQRRILTDPDTGIVTIVTPNPHTQEVVRQIMTALLEWARNNRSREGFLNLSPEQGLSQMLQEKPQYLVALRLVQSIPGEVIQLAPPRHRGSSGRPLYQVVIETAIGFIPIVGNAMAIYETTSGRTLFGHRLSTLERSIVGASILLPVAGRLVKRGRSLYTTRRMEQLYGADAREWSRILASGERLSSNPLGYASLREGSEAVRLQRPLGITQRIRIERTLASGVTQGTRVQARAPETVRQAFQRLSARHPILAGLDELAMVRVIDRGPSPAHMKGQLLEELLENRVADLLRSHRGLTGMGHYQLRGPVEFVPGHLIRDNAGRQISDGMLIHRQRDQVQILSIFEAKAGRKGARELSLGGGSYSSLSGPERLELWSYARDIHRERLEIARLSGDPQALASVPSINAIQSQILLRERGGQIRRDMERLGASADETLTTLVIGSVATPVQLSPTRTLVVGVVPKDLATRQLRQELRDLPYNTEIWGIDITRSALNDIVKALASLP